ncbi:MAG: C4-type zinc ribbon domain-containing protein [Sphaerochaetaceae bacterium]|nr:C4-type zinc ribbon domain-containing protein [Sphaerochaetaceae bacterium]
MQKEVFTKLAKLQDSLKAKFRVEEEIKQLPHDLKIKKVQLEKIKSDFEELNLNVQTIEKECKTLRFEYDNAVVAHENNQKQMEVISTQREFEALEKQISDSHILEQNLLKQLHAKEKSLTQLQEDLELKRSVLDEIETEVKEEEAKHDEILVEKLTLKDQLEEECNKIVEDYEISDDLFKKFSSIVKNKEGSGIVPIHDNVCEGCHMLLPIQFVNDVRSLDQIEFCPYCSRVLYYEETALAPDTDTMEIEEGSLTTFADDDEFDLDNI